MNQPQDRAAHQLGAIDPEDAPDYRRGVGHDTVTIDKHDGVGTVRGERPESLLRLPPCLVRHQTAVFAQHEFLPDQHHRRKQERPVEHLDELVRDLAHGERDEDRVARREGYIW